MPKRTPKPPSAVDNDPYRSSLRRRDKLNRILSDAQQVCGSEFIASGVASDEKIGHDLWDVLETFRHRLAKSPAWKK